MAKVKTVYTTSDLSGTKIEEGQEAQILVTYRENGRKVAWIVDATMEEAKEIGKVGRFKKMSTGRRKQTSGDGNEGQTLSDQLVGANA
jgi:hypothetical protein